MTEQLNQVLNFLTTLTEQVAETGEPSFVIFVNAVVLCLVAALILGRLRTELRSQAWNKLTVDERREKILDVLREAFDTAEWLYSHLSPADEDEKVMIAVQKKEAAMTYAKAELNAMGASGADLVTVPHRLEWLCDLRKNDRMRYSKLPRAQA